MAAIYVEPARWRTGVGARLLRAALGAPRADGFDAVTLWVLGDNTLGRAFYERLGFAADGATQVLTELEAREVGLRAGL